MFQMREQDKTLEKGLNRVEIGNLPDKEFKVMIKMMLKELGRRMDEHSENFNRVVKYKKEQNRAEEYN